jgi:hypothetical protein
MSDQIFETYHIEASLEHVAETGEVMSFLDLELGRQKKRKVEVSRLISSAR